MLEFVQKQRTSEFQGERRKIEKPPSVGVWSLQREKKLKDVFGKTLLMLKEKLLWDHGSVTISHFITECREF